MPQLNQLTDVQLINTTHYINLYRTRYQAKTITYNKHIAAFSQSYAATLIQTKGFKHSGNPLYGENLGFLKGYQNHSCEIIRKTIDAWYSEARKYEFGSENAIPGTDHFTQLCWRNSTQYGIGYAYDPESSIAVVVMNFNPPGNVADTYNANVLPPRFMP
ncbi:unnamed protein product [Phytophthora fragariaefolia]|uniref:Unnamed protein product n=1 Tax=Phytophthora fragariaefolia TaxID=1490495 RepID=A0A9W6XJV1_9STRA|nr:unnamed protein product [Phytophthora fragariaefolia]